MTKERFELARQAWKRFEQKPIEKFADAYPEYTDFYSPLVSYSDTMGVKVSAEDGKILFDLFTSKASIHVNFGDGLEFNTDGHIISCSLLTIGDDAFIHLVGDYQFELKAMKRIMDFYDWAEKYREWRE